jgi:23S rRNA pseudouridine1911/1915/1917 synthase
LQSVTRTRIKALIEDGFVSRAGEAVNDPALKTRAGEIYVVDIPAVAPAEPHGEAIPLRVLHEDEDVVVVDKPAGLVVHPAPGARSGTLVNALIAHCGASLSGVGGVARPGIVHRIDKDTSGLLVVAKHDRAHQRLARQFAAHSIERVYEAITVGCPRPGIGTIDAALGRSARDRARMAVVDEFEWDEEKEDYAPRAGARRAVTRYRVIESLGRARARIKGDALAALVECRLETGRTHQIRAHMAHVGCPLIGDPTYGRGPGLAGLRPGDAAADAALAALAGFGRQALHARVIGFDHPLSGARVRFETPPPVDFAALLAALRAL